MRKPSKFDRYNAKQTQVVQIKFPTGAPELAALLDAIATLKQAKGYPDNKAVFVSSVLEAAAQLQDES